MSIQTVTTVTECRELLGPQRAAGARIALVPTMGALHDGHAALVSAAVAAADVVVVSIFVNPLQFGDAADLDRYPRTLDRDRELLAELGADLVFAPTADQMYPDGPSATRVSAGGLGNLYEGASRPGHFDGVLTVVTKLVNIVGPDVVVFGEKDAQQVFLVRRMLRDLNQPVEVHEVHTVREPDGLARSSRNVFLAGAARQNGLALVQALDAVTDAAAHGSEQALAAGRRLLDAAPGVRPDYLVAVLPDTFAPAPPEYQGPARLLVAAQVGDVRLIDTRLVQFG